MHPQAIRVMQRFVGTPLGQAVVQLLIAWLVLQPLWEVGQRTARDTAPLPEMMAWVWRLVRPGAAHAAVVDVPHADGKKRCQVPFYRQTIFTKSRLD